MFSQWTELTVLTMDTVDWNSPRPQYSSPSRVTSLGSSGYVNVSGDKQGHRLIHVLSKNQFGGVNGFPSRLTNWAPSQNVLQRVPTILGQLSAGNLRGWHRD
jgi:hypothetical protein